MEGFFFALAMAALAIIIHWATINDRKKDWEKTVGFLAMRSSGTGARVENHEPAAVKGHTTLKQ